MFGTIIIGIDGRPQDREALALAGRLGGPNAELIAIHVAVTGQGPRGSRSTVEPTAVTDAESIIDDFTEERPWLEGVVTRAASVGAGLRELAIGAGADLIVMASSRRGPVGRIVAGDAVRDLLRDTPCPVALAPAGYAATGPLRAITVGYDGSPEAAAAVDFAIALGRRDDAAVRAVEVLEPRHEVAYSSPGAVDDDRMYRTAQARMDRLAGQRGIRGTVVTGRATHELARASRSADLLAIGLHQYGLLDRLLVGSTGSALRRETSTPLLLAPPVTTTRAGHVADALDQD